MPAESIATTAAPVGSYVDNSMNVTDASLVWLADRCGASGMITIDEAQFDAYRTPRGKALHNLI